mgnify:CR=1 FL=1
MNHNEEIKTIPGNGISYVVPQFISKNSNENVTLKFRVRKPLKDQWVIVKSGEKIVKKTFYQAVLPSEMILIDLSLDKMKDVVERDKNGMLRRKMSNESFLTIFMLIILGALIVAFSFIVPTFFQVGTFSNILAQQSYLIIIGIGVTFILLTGNFDFSVGAVAACAGVLAVYFCQPVEGSASALGMNNGLGMSVPAAIWRVA